MRVVVIGAGILGSSVAYHLARKGIAVEIVDEGHQGKATLAGAGIVCPWATKATDPQWYALYAAGAASYAGLVDGLVERGEDDLGYRRVGALVVAETAAELDAADERIQSRIGDAPEAGDVRRVTRRRGEAALPAPARGPRGHPHPGRRAGERAPARRGHDAGGRRHGRRAPAGPRDPRHAGRPPALPRQQRPASRGRRDRRDGGRLGVADPASYPATAWPRSSGRAAKGADRPYPAPRGGHQSLAGGAADDQPLPAGVRRFPRRGGRDPRGQLRLRLSRDRRRAGGGAQCGTRLRAGPGLRHDHRDPDRVPARRREHQAHPRPRAGDRRPGDRQRARRVGPLHRTLCRPSPGAALRRRDARHAACPLRAGRRPAAGRADRTTGQQRPPQQGPT